MTLRVGDELRCPHCGAWHPLYQPFADHTTAARDFLYFRCRGGEYFGGQLGLPSRRVQTRQSPAAVRLRRDWVCEAHPGQPWPHDDCPGPGMLPEDQNEA